MHAIVNRGPYRVRVESKDVPKVEHPNDTVVWATGRRSVGQIFSCTAG